MKVFISWSGDQSLYIASALCDFLRELKCGLQPWFSENIEPGELWHQKLEHAINSSDYSVVCLTPEAMDSHWLSFEAGAMSRPSHGLPGGRVCPYLIGLNRSSVIGPLSHFQAQECSKEATKKLLITLLKNSDPSGKSPYLVYSEGSPHQEPDVSLAQELDRKFEASWSSLLPFIKKAEDKVRETGTGYVLDRFCFRMVIEMYLSYVTQRITKTFLGRIDSLKKELTPKVRENIKSMRSIAQAGSSRNASVDDLRAKLRDKGLPDVLDNLIMEICDVVRESRQSLAPYRCEELYKLPLPMILDGMRPYSALVDNILEALDRLHRGNWEIISAYFREKQKDLRERMDQVVYAGEAAGAEISRMLSTEVGIEFIKATVHPPSQQATRDSSSAESEFGWNPSSPCEETFIPA